MLLLVEKRQLIYINNQAFNSYVRPIFEYCSSCRSPYLVQYVDNIEKVQIRFIKKLRGLKHKSYPERLKFVNNERLENRRITAYVIVYYKTCTIFVDIYINDLFEFPNNERAGKVFK